MSALLGNCAPVSRSSSSRESDIRLLSYFFQQVASRKRYRNPGYFCLWNSESGEIWHGGSEILGFGIWNTAQGIRNPTYDWNPVTKTGIQYLESRIHGVESRIQDCLGFPYVRRNMASTPVERSTTTEQTTILQSFISLKFELIYTFVFF